jgi:hypothetical protein
MSSVKDVLGYLAIGDAFLEISSLILASSCPASSKLLRSQLIMGKTMGKTTTSCYLLHPCLRSMGWVFCLSVSILWGNAASAGTSVEPSAAVSEEIPKEVPEEVPEEVLQIQVGLEANSPLTGQAQVVDAYAQAQQQLRVGATEVSPRLSPSVYRAVELLRLRKVLKSLLPFF